MKKLIIICEGKTELLFCSTILELYFRQINIQIEYPLISHSNGGIVKWVHLKPQIETNLLIDSTCFVTTFIDFYAIYEHHDFPDWRQSLAEPSKSIKMIVLENGMRNSIAPNLQPRFIPYIQLHEFEALIFSDYSSFEEYYEPREANFNRLREICSNNPNPEEINDSPTTAPSKRLETNIRRYDKVTHGPDICEIIGLPKIRSKCPRFHEWITKLERI